MAGSLDGACSQGIDTGFVALGYARVAVLGVVKGLIELLPISSTAKTRQRQPTELPRRLFSLLRWVRNKRADDVRFSRLSPESGPAEIHPLVRCGSNGLPSSERSTVRWPPSGAASAGSSPPVPEVC